VLKNVTKRAHVVLPVDVVADIDKLVGKRGRSAFLTEVAQREIKLLQQREALRDAAGAWKLENHPELAGGAEHFIRQLRELDAPRLESLEKRRGSK
jgi:Arc/MetJ-type ribon-helix-helix transcriptional regulator